MKKRNTIFALLLALLAGCSGGPAYKDAALPTEKRVNDLISRMTLEEKVRQLDLYAGKEVLIDRSTIDTARLAAVMGDLGMGGIHDFYPTDAGVTNQLQRYAVEKTRLGIPVIITAEALHGYLGKGSTSFPVPLALASSWDTTLIRQVGRVIATEMRAHGPNFALNPNLDLAREPRWGRVEETYGEDTYLSSRLGVNMVKGLQGENLSDSNAVVAEPKHFGVHSIPESGSNWAPVSIGEREARSAFLYVFEKAVTEGKARGIMAAYHEMDGVPCSANKWLLTDLLRGEWGFKGMVLSDLGAVRMQHTFHCIAKDVPEAAANAVKAGLDMQFYDFTHEEFQQGLIEAVKRGDLSEKDIDKAVAHVLGVKFDLGLFENPYIDPALAAKVQRCPAHNEISKQASLESIVLLKNENNTLPLPKNIRSIALIGPLANRSALGGYTTFDAKAITVYEGLKAKFGDKVKITLAGEEVKSGLFDIPATSMTPSNGARMNGLYAEYYNNPNWEGEPVYSAVETNLAQYWNNVPPVPEITTDRFSIRWTGTITPQESGLYEFNFVPDDFGSFAIDGEVVMDDLAPELYNHVERTAVKYLKKGVAYPVEMKYAKQSNFSAVKLKWRRIDDEPSQAYYDNITRIAANSDAVVVCVGESPEEVGEHLDRTDLNLSAGHDGLVKAAVKSGKPVTVVLLNGRPLTVNYIAENAPAVVEAWFPGEYGGEAVADVLFGDYNPSGKLTISFPHSVGQLPVYYNKKPSAKRAFVDNSGLALFPFGHGLSYTQFEYDGLKLSQTEIRKDQSVDATVTVTNTGKVDGTEVVQLYVRDKVSSIATPVRTLKGFARVDLKAGESKEVTMTLTPEHLSLVNHDMKRVVEPGEFEIMVGSSSVDIRQEALLTVK